MKEFFGIPGGKYSHPIEGFMSWQHLTLVSTCAVIMLVLAIWLGIRNRNKDLNTKNKVLICSAILIDAFELFKLVILCIRHSDPFAWIYHLPLFLCSIQLITIPFAAFSRGRAKEACLDFVAIFGLLGAFAGTYGAANIYNVAPVFSFDPIVSAITHFMAGFASLYILITGMATLKKKNMVITFGILFAFCIAAYVANQFLPTNYMFMRHGEGTPYDIFYKLVNGNKIIYPLIVVSLFVIFISLFYFVCSLLAKRKKNK